MLDRLNFRSIFIIISLN